MKSAFWTYPWDLADIGIAQVCDEIQSLGFDAVSVASVYHAGRFLQVRSPKRRAYFPQDGSCYFRPDPKIWSEQQIQPITSSLAREQDILRELIELRDGGGLDVSAWTVCLHNTALGEQYPDLVTRNAWGDPNFYNLCPSTPAAQAYVANLVRDLSQNYRPNRIELESPNFLGFAHEHHHEKDMVGLPPEGDFLMALCFCDSCKTHARAKGIDADGVQRRVRVMIDEIVSAEKPVRIFPGFNEAGLDSFNNDSELKAYVDLRKIHVSSLIAAAKEACHPDVDLMLIDGQDGWLAGCDHHAIAKIGLQIMLCAYDMEDCQVEKLMTYAKTLPGQAGGQIGLRLGYPEYAGAQEFAARLAQLRALGAEGVNIYNYGLVPKGRLSWLSGQLS